MALYIYKAVYNSESDPTASRSPSQIAEVAPSFRIHPLPADDRESPVFGLCRPDGSMGDLEVDDFSFPPYLGLTFREDKVKKPSKKALSRMVKDFLAKQREEAEEEAEDDFLEDGGTEGKREPEEPMSFYEASVLVLDHYMRTAPPTSSFSKAIVVPDWKDADGETGVAILISAKNLEDAFDIARTTAQVVWEKPITLQSYRPFESFIGDPQAILHKLCEVVCALNQGGLTGSFAKIGNWDASVYFDDFASFTKVVENDELREKVKISSADPAQSDQFWEMVKSDQWAIDSACFEIVLRRNEGAEDRGVDERKESVNFSLCDDGGLKKGADRIDVTSEFGIAISVATLNLFTIAIDCLASGQVLADGVDVPEPSFEEHEDEDMMSEQALFG